MCDAQRGTSFCGWHRHKLEWLSADRKTYLSSGVLKETLTPLSAGSGLSMIVVPVGKEKNPTEVFVVEVAQPICGRSGNMRGEGVLIYSVDASEKSGQLPMVVYPWKIGSNKDYGFLPDAPFQEGGSFELDESPMTVKVLKKVGENYEVEVKVI